MSQNPDATHKNEINITRLEGLIREEFAKMNGRFDLHTQEIKTVSISLTEALLRLEKHIDDNDLHKCIEHDSDINNAFKDIRKINASIDKMKEESENINKDIQKIHKNEEILQAQIKVLKWVAGAVVSLAMIGKEVVVWVMSK